MGVVSMCGRYTLHAKEEEIIKTFQLTDPILDYEPSYNIAPGQDVLVIIHDGKKKRAGYLRWGLVPSWAKDERIRSEEHTSELQSRGHLVCRLLLEKKIVT